MNVDQQNGRDAMRVQAVRSWLTALTIWLCTAGPVFSAETLAPGWEHSYKAGETDRNGAYLGGSEIMHLVSHKGALFAGNGYWMDSRNIAYGGLNPLHGWAQVLRLDHPGGKWEVDLEMGMSHMRATILKSITFATDGVGKRLKDQVNLLVACSETPTLTTHDCHMYTRDDESGKWIRSTVFSGPKPPGEEDRMPRAMCVHRDQVTGVDRVFISIGKLGIFSGVYDDSVMGKVRWDSQSETGPVEIRPMAIIEAGARLYFSAGRKIYRRKDGPAPTYAVVQDMRDLYPDVAVSPMGGIRGLSAIQGPEGDGKSLIFAMAEGNQSHGNIYRLDPTGDGRWVRTQEACLADLMSQYLSGNPVHCILAAYNCFYPVVDPATKETVHLIGFESWITGHKFPLWGANKDGGFYAGGMYAIRDAKGIYRLKEVNGRMDASQTPLVSVRVFAASPFQEPAGGTVYFGGHDGNAKPSHNMAWIFSTSLENALLQDLHDRIKPTGGL